MTNAFDGLGIAVLFISAVILATFVVVYFFALCAEVLEIYKHLGLEKKPDCAHCKGEKQ